MSEHQSCSSGNESAFDICVMIVEEECYLDAPPADGDNYERAMHEVGLAIRDRIRCAQQEASGGAQGAPDQRLTEDMTLAHNARKTAIEECAKIADAECLKHSDWAKMAEHVLSDHVAACKQIASALTAQEIAAAVRALSAVTPSPGPGEWQPIETAPRDGTRILLFKAGRGAFEGWWHKAWPHPEEYWMDDADSEPDPTHWRPTLPLPSTPRATPAVERCPTCNETDASYRYEPPFRRCNDPWHTDDHLRAKALRMPPAHRGDGAQ